jgi:hypothetical protein
MPVETRPADPTEVMVAAIEKLHATIDRQTVLAVGTKRSLSPARGHRSQPS